MTEDPAMETNIPLMVRQMCGSILGSGSYPTVQAKIDTLVGFLRNTNRKTPFAWEEMWNDLLEHCGPDSTCSAQAQPGSGGRLDVRFPLPDLEAMRKIMNFPMIPDGMDREAFLGWMTKCKDDSVHHPEELARELAGCGMNAVGTDGGGSLELEGLVIECEKNEGDQPGIPSLRVIEAVYEMVTGDFPRSVESAPSDRYRELQSRLERFWKTFPDHPVST
jgi:hypothetical protein